FERAEFGEDLDWSRRVLEAGWAIAYQPSSRVLHCHRTSVRGSFRRSLADHSALARSLGVDYFDEIFGSSYRRLARDIGRQIAADSATIRAARLGASARLRWIASSALADVAVGLAYVKVARNRRP